MTITRQLIEQACKWCRGTGHGDHSNCRCEDCDGKGKVRICSVCGQAENECNCEEDNDNE